MISSIVSINAEMRVFTKEAKMEIDGMGKGELWNQRGWFDEEKCRST
jgi:hypothetical protein